MKKFIKKFNLKRLIVFFLLLVTVFSTVTSYRAFPAFADGKTAKINVSDPLTDLLGDENFHVKDYPFDKNRELTVVYFSEYCYSFYTEKQEDFGLYIYVYNPKALSIKDTSLNRVEMAVGYDKNGNPNDYEKFELKLCSFSKEPNYYRLFYKFKVVDHKTNGLTIYDRLNSNERRYDVAGVELVTANAVCASDKTVGKTYKYTGYAVGYGPNFENQKESTLSCNESVLETVSLDVKHTFWRSNTSSKGAHYQHQLNTVYFTVPNRLLEEYGKLQKIKAEWYEYKTKDIVVTSDETAHNIVKPFLGKTANYDTCNRGFTENCNALIGGGWLADWAFNCNTVYDDFICSEQIDILYYLFKATDIGSYDPYAEVTSIGGVDSNTLYDYILSYDKSYVNGTVKDGAISADLFESDIDSYRKIANEYGVIKQGYSYYDFDADLDILDWKAYNPGESSFTENVKMFGLWDALWQDYDGYDLMDGAENISPILMLEYNDLLGTKADISDRLHVSASDVNAIKAVYDQALKDDETVVLFRFALTDYYSAPVDIYCHDGVLKRLYSDLAYRAWQSVFLDFDIIQLTFNRGGKMTVIPVVADPQDIVAPVTPPTEDESPSLWDKIMDVLKKVGAWLIFIVAVVFGLITIYIVLKSLSPLSVAGLHVAWKIVIAILIVVAIVLIGVFVVPWIVNIISSLGGLI